MQTYEISRVLYSYKNILAGGIEMPEDKTLLKKDLALVLKINAKLRYDNITKVKQIYQILVDKNMLRTSIGQRYLKKLESIIQGNVTNKCLICSKQCTSQSAICAECLAKLQPPTENTPKTEKILSTENIPTKETVVSNQVSEANSNIQTEPKNRKDKKDIIIAILAIAIILVSTGLSTTFAILTLVSLGVLIYNSVKKKPKRNAAIAFVVFFVLTGILGNFSNGDPETADFARNKVNVVTFLEQYKEMMIQQASELSEEDFTVKFLLASDIENCKTYQIRVLDVDCGSIQLVCDEKGNIYSILGYSTRDDSIGALLMITLVQTIHPDLSSEDAEALIASSKLNSSNDTYNISGNYAYGYYNDTNGLMLAITTKDNYMKAIQ